MNENITNPPLAEKKLVRVPHWQRALRDSIHKHNCPFAYGDNDCAKFVCDSVLAMTGTDIYSDFRGKYSDLKSSLKVMNDVCGSASIEAIADHITTKFEMPEVDPHYAQRGDIVLVPVGENGDLALGIVGHDNLNAHVVGQTGQLKLPYTKIAKKAWRV